MINTESALIAVSILLIAQSVNVWWLVRLTERAQGRSKFWREMYGEADRGSQYWFNKACTLQARLAPFERVKDERGRFVARDRAA